MLSFYLAMLNKCLMPMKVPDYQRLPRKLDDRQHRKDIYASIYKRQMSQYSNKTVTLNISLVYLVKQWLLLSHQMIIISCPLIANEIRAWLLHYSRPVLSRILLSTYLNQYALLCGPCLCYLGKKIVKKDEDKSQIVLDDFTQSLPTIYCK